MVNASVPCNDEQVNPTHNYNRRWWWRSSRSRRGRTGKRKTEYREQWENSCSDNREQFWLYFFFSFHLLLLSFLFSSSMRMRLGNEIKCDGINARTEQITFGCCNIVLIWWRILAFRLPLSHSSHWMLLFVSVVWWAISGPRRNRMAPFNVQCACCVTVSGLRSQLVYLVHDAESSAHVHRFTRKKWNTTFLPTSFQKPNSNWTKKKSASMLWLAWNLIVASMWSIRFVCGGERKPKHHEFKINATLCRHATIATHSVRSRCVCVCAYASNFVSYLPRFATFGDAWESSEKLFITWKRNKNAKNKTIAMANGRRATATASINLMANRRISAATGGCLSIGPPPLRQFFP